jgi:hypothetical protein
MFGQTTYRVCGVLELIGNGLTHVVLGFRWIQWSLGRLGGWWSSVSEPPAHVELDLIGCDPAKVGYDMLSEPLQPVHVLPKSGGFRQFDGCARCTSLILLESA